MIQTVEIVLLVIGICEALDTKTVFICALVCEAIRIIGGIIKAWAESEIYKKYL